jgi:hypothetical protein
MKRAWLIVGAAIILIAAFWYVRHSRSQEVVVLPEGMEYFGNEVRGDFNSDGKDDAAFIVTQQPGGSGTFFYIAATLGTAQGSHETNSVFLGDRIAPQSTEFRNGIIIVNYADRNPGEPMTAQPSRGVSRQFRVTGGQIQEIAR